MVTIANSDCHHMSDSDSGFFSIIPKKDKALTVKTAKA